MRLQFAFSTLSLLGYCGLECPIPTFPTSELRRAATLSLVLGWVGYVLTLVVFCVMVFSKRCAKASVQLRIINDLQIDLQIVSGDACADGSSRRTHCILRVRRTFSVSERESWSA